MAVYGVRRWLAWGLLVVAVIYLVREPVAAADTASAVLGGLSTAADALSTFVGALT